jgi:nucleoid DNA-binding protein
MAEKKRLSKSQFVATIADKCGLSKKQAGATLEAMNALITRELGKTGEVTIPGLIKLVVVKKAAVPAGERRNPFTGEMKMYPAKPARKVVKARPVKALKDAVA